MKKQNRIILKKVNWRAFFILILYLIFISFRLFFYAYAGNVRYSMQEISYNLLPFDTIIEFLTNRQDMKLEVLLYNLAGNIAALTPLGFLLPAAFRELNSFKAVFTAGFFIILTAELLQLVTRRGVFDVDDIILNILGTMLGYLIYKTVKKKW